ncbi:MAG: hypothetical protein A3J08_04300 [Candidatus Lloydbacteria bacterium RIFCSPLOWO2_02_FULL_51_11]|uniref:tRNA N6-adenosine threonylcarbamoyltransferase n=1 Tax=Candidatus Lloydbacteria bacterium RIFCSPLOWO2_02_FULL_51_11 TaxID=1798667 RepID=A0A1G2DM96_9BACT|nr:MAG: hypothetical protein A3J08_04300 [Candidatus Lloydbacteria bacterium RIFCSPLOWO2_02_FULL_51_11]
MKILAIETSCDETAVAILECSGTPKDGVNFRVGANIIHSQVAIHQEYGGVFPSLAKREHSRNLVPVLKQALQKNELVISDFRFQISDLKKQKIEKILDREPELLEQFLRYIPTIEKPNVDAIAVTYGPGLEPALWVGINFAKALALVWDVPIIPINHMEGHFFSALLKKNDTIPDIQHTTYNIQKIHFPLLALLVSGGHTELVVSRDWLSYERIGETRDDAAGEAFDKVARMLGLPYPGGPAIAREAARFQRQETRDKGHVVRFPRPMKDSGDFGFSFSGLKTAVLYALKGRGRTPALVAEFAYEFQEAVTDVLVSKTIRAAKEYDVRAVLLGGGVSANTRLKDALGEKLAAHDPDIRFAAAPREFTGDNAVMIGVAAYLHAVLNQQKYDPGEITAQGTLRM